MSANALPNTAIIPVDPDVSHTPHLKTFHVLSVETGELFGMVGEILAASGDDPALWGFQTLGEPTVTAITDFGPDTFSLSDAVDALLTHVLLSQDAQEDEST